MNDAGKKTMQYRDSLRIDDWQIVMMCLELCLCHTLWFIQPTQQMTTTLMIAAHDFIARCAKSTATTMMRGNKIVINDKSLVGMGASAYHLTITVLDNQLQSTGTLLSSDRQAARGFDMCS